MILAGGIGGGVSAGMSGGSVGDVFVGIGKGMLTATLLAGSMFLIAGAFAVTGGISSVLGLTMFTFGVTIPLDILEVAGYQGHKSSYEGRSFWDSANDINNALFANIGRILLGSTLVGGGTVIGSNVLSNISLLSEYHETYLLLKNSWKSSKALSIAFKDVFLEKAGFWSVVSSAFSIVEQAVESVSAIFGNPDIDNGKWILF